MLKKCISVKINYLDFSTCKHKNLFHFLTLRTTFMIKMLLYCITWNHFHSIMLSLQKQKQLQLKSTTFSPFRISVIIFNCSNDFLKLLMIFFLILLTDHAASFMQNLHYLSYVSYIHFISNSYIFKWIR